MTSLGIANLTIEHERLPVWVITDHPSDAVNSYVARLHYGLPEPQVTATFMFSGDLEWLRGQLADAGYTRLERMHGDDPVIVETWL